MVYLFPAARMFLLLVSCVVPGVVAQGNFNYDPENPMMNDVSPRHNLHHQPPHLRHGQQHQQQHQYATGPVGAVHPALPPAPGLHVPAQAPNAGVIGTGQRAVGGGYQDAAMSPGQYAFAGSSRPTSIDWASSLVLDPKHEATTSTTCEGEGGRRSAIVLARDLQHSMVSGNCLSRAVKCMRQQTLWCLDEAKRTGHMRTHCLAQQLDYASADCHDRYATDFCTAERIAAYPCPTTCVYDEYRFGLSCASRGGTLCQRKTYQGANSLTYQSLCVASRTRCTMPSVALALATFYGRERLLRTRPDTSELVQALEDERVVCSAAIVDYGGRLSHVGETASATRSTKAEVGSVGAEQALMPDYLYSPPDQQPPPPLPATQGASRLPAADQAPEVHQPADAADGPTTDGSQYIGENVVEFQHAAAVDGSASSQNSLRTSAGFVYTMSIVAVACLLRL